ncbi:17166_t:CDS:2 [Funneliformis geosporum]|nr:17166_t:CDS:2 [Funneliformis geosporum]
MNMNVLLSGLNGGIIGTPSIRNNRNNQRKHRNHFRRQRNAYISFRRNLQHDTFLNRIARISTQNSNDPLINGFYNGNQICRCSKKSNTTN